MKIDNPTGDPDCRHDAYSVRFEERRVEDLKFPVVDSIAFERVRNLSAELDALYSSHARAVRPSALDAPLRERSRMAPSHAGQPVRIRKRAQSSARGDGGPRRRSSEANPHPTTDDNPFKLQERATIKAISELTGGARRLRDAGFEHLVR